MQKKIQDLLKKFEPDHERSDTYLTENWGIVKTFDDFMQKLASILEDKEKSDRKLQEGCGTSCDYYVPVI